MSFKVLVSTRFFDPAAEKLLLDNQCTLVRTGLPHDVQDDVLTPDALNTLLKDVDGWIVGTVPVTRALMAANPQLKVIARRGVGYNNVDIEAARELKRHVTIASGGNEASVADHAVAMFLSLAKKLNEGHHALQQGRWTTFVTTELFEKTVGLIGFGRIARAVAKRLKGFDATILAYDPYPNPQAAEALGVRFVELPELLKHSDYVSLHLPLNTKTKHLINADALSSMKQGSYLINTARGGLIDEAALLQALTSGHLAGAGLDVFENEPDLDDPPVKGLLAHPQVIASAHAAGSSEEGLQRTNRIAAQTVIDLLNGRTIDPACLVI
jgi:D-3-phosphoglycerate dehydrogenase / 2-oxoglutarate reductase